MLAISWLKNHLVTTTLVLVAVLGLLIHLGHSRANAQNGFANDNNGAQDEKLAIQIGYAVAPVTANTTGLDPDLVGLGSYIVNVTGDCNGCHSAGPATEFTKNGNPYTRLAPNGPYSGTTQVNTGTYLGGGRDFEGLPRAQFALAHHLDPNCTGTPNSSCTPFPFDGSKLQIMRWPNFQNMTDRQLTAVYQYLSAIPCIQGADPNEPPNRCQ